MALTSGQKAGLAVVAGCFIAFALVSSFLVPHYRPDFPGGRGLRWFMAAVLVLTAAMLSAVVFLAAESKEEGVTAQGTSPTVPSTTGPGPPSGDVAAGKTVFETAGCTTCHTLAAAGSTGTIGPNLDQAKPSAALVVERVTNGKGVMPSFQGRLTEQQIQDVAAFVSQSTQG
jgi:mono/diheme cytochrome c family protein